MIGEDDHPDPGLSEVLTVELASTRGAVAGVLLRSILVAVTLVAVYYVVPVSTRSTSAVLLRIAGASALIALVVVWQVRSVSRSERPLLRGAEGLTVAVTLMVVLFATAYVTMSDWEGTAFSEPLGRTGALYFTLTTLTTVGFGDIAARTDAARVVVMLQIVFNVTVIGFAIRLISNAARERAREKGRISGRVERAADG